MATLWKKITKKTTMYPIDKNRCFFSIGDVFGQNFGAKLLRTLIVPRAVAIYSWTVAICRISSLRPPSIQAQASIHVYLGFFPASGKIMGINPFLANCCLKSDFLTIFAIRIHNCFVECKK
ncbi:MAG: hypothetical protein II786_06085 [Muribaculaceae bacterium]|nr:hypothetical protein [Muribaculaceae bacterium]